MSAALLPPLLLAADYALLDADLEGAVSRLWDQLQLHSPFAGKPLTDRNAIVAETLASGSTSANPRPVRAVEVHTLLDRIFASPRERQPRERPTRSGDADSPPITLRDAH